MGWVTQWPRGDMSERTGSAVQASIRAGDDEVKVEEDELVKHWLAGERAAFARIVELFQARVTRLVWRLLGWREGGQEVDDVVQEVFVAVLAKAGGFRGQSSLWTWLRAIAVNTCRGHRRKQLVRWRYWRELWSRQEGSGEAADERMDRDESSAAVRRAVAKLGAKEREVVVLYYLEECSVREIVEILGVQTGAVEVRLHRARRKLRELLAGHEL
jgi:RNA polymerase sigma-70 factor (ECF subfamily)